MDCPVCKVTLLISDKQGIEIDYCPQCRGIWLDRGELEKIVEKSTLYSQQNRHEETFSPQNKHPNYQKKQTKKRNNPFEDILDIFDF